MKIRPALSARQQLTLSPRLYQSLKVLRLGAADLKELIQKELDENPMLEIPEPADFDTRAVAGRELWEDYLGANRHSGGHGSRQAATFINITELAASPVTLSDHLTMQLDMEGLSPGDYRIGLALIGSLDEDGYLRDPVEIVAGAIGAETSQVRKVLAVVQALDPAGIGARSLEECLLIQLRQLGAGRVALEIARDHLADVARGAGGEIARALKVPPARVEKAVALIRGLNPSPGSLFDASPPAAAVIPDVYVRKERGQIQVLANREVLPDLRTSAVYEQLASGAGNGADSETAGYLQSKLKEASRLIRDIDQRRSTVTRVARAIAAAQPGFFDYGPESLKPLTLEDIATAISLHPSTISRAILGKYMSTPFGIFELRYFFSAGYAAAGGELAATAVKKRLAQMIADEDPQKPLSDQQLAEALKKESITISRRTVAKYREEQAIPPSWQRKRKAV
ncbi:MAG: RNA polymerase factor sigma-54 [Thermoleophilia bacterium]